MGQPRSPTKPVYAHHRLMRELLTVNHGKDNIEARPGELDRVAKVFRRAGGSWHRLYHGSIDDLSLLRKVIKMAVKRDFLTKAPEWEG